MKRSQTELECLDNICDAMEKWVDNNYWHYDYWRVIDAVVYIKFSK